MSSQDLSIRLAGKVADAVALAHGLPVPGVAGVAIEALLRQLLAVHDEQAERLRRLEATVQQLMKQPWHTAQMHLREALLPGRSSEQVVISLDRAGIELRKALSVLPDKTRGRAYVAFDLAVVLMTLGDDQASGMYVRESLRTATDLLLDKERQEFSKLAGKYTPRKPWPDPKRLQNYRPEDSGVPAVRLIHAIL